MKVSLICVLLLSTFVFYNESTPAAGPGQTGRSTVEDEACRLTAKDTVRMSGGSIQKVCTDYIRCCERKCSPKRAEGKCVYHSETKFSPETYCRCKNF
uniref:Uncharacterized protein n=1 Tax=Romanomermis culicivorax TaxID=13658 RepID=A0A915IPF0_ROMCU